MIATARPAEPPDSGAEKNAIAGPAMSPGRLHQATAGERNRPGMSADARRFGESHPDSTASPGRAARPHRRGSVAARRRRHACRSRPRRRRAPAGRGYEKVSPADKDGQDILNGLDKVAVDGDAATYISFGAFGDSEGGGLVTSFISDRSATDWLTQAIGPAQVAGGRPRQLALRRLLRRRRELDHRLPPGDPGFDGATPGTVNLYRRDPDGSKHVLTRGLPPVLPGGFPHRPKLRRRLGRSLARRVHSRSSTRRRP